MATNLSILAKSAQKCGFPKTNLSIFDWRYQKRGSDLRTFSFSLKNALFPRQFRPAINSPVPHILTFHADAKIHPRRIFRP
jgi:hypothetical protein